jgi:hypothetical protein
MNRRLHERYTTNLEVTVAEVASPEHIASGCIADVSLSGLCIHLSHRIPPGAAVKVQTEECLMFGHVVYSDRQAPFRTGIEVVQVLFGESDLSRLINAVRDESEEKITA